MFEPDASNPYSQPTIPYQPDRRYTDPSLYQQQAFVSPPPTSRAHAGAAHTIPARPVAPVRPAQAAQPTMPRMSKAEALALVDRCKKWLVAGSIVTFGVLTGLVAGHAIGSTASNANSTNGPGPSSNQSAPASNSSNTSPSSNGGFFQQGGSNFGNGNSSQPPVSGSHTS
jgi:hypothetical protein